MGDSAFAAKHKVLMEHLKCDKHKEQKQCWKPLGPPFNGKICITLSAFHLDAWVTAWLNEAATKFTPPESPEFIKLAEEHRSGSRRRARPSSVEIAQTVQGTTVQVFYDQTQKSTSSFSPNRTRSRSLEYSPSPIKGFQPKDYTRAGLQAFLTWCRDYYDDTEYLDAFTSMQNQSMGIDLFKCAINNTKKTDNLIKVLKVDCGIKSGMALRLVDDFKTWYESINGEVS